jgi:peptidyl-prolyl cis-trans isomerase D
MKKKRNTEAVEVSPNKLVSAHVIAVKPAYTRPISEVGPEIRNKLLLQKATVAALQQGRAKLAQLQSGRDDGISWQTAESVSRRDSHGLDANVMAAVFKADISKLPAYAGVEGSQTYTLVNIERVDEAPEPTEAERKSMEGQLRKALVQQELSDYFMGLKGRARITVNRGLISPKPAD